MSIYYEDSSVTLHHGDCIEVMAAMPDCSADAVVTDPPYGLEFMSKEWDSFKPSAARIRHPSERDGESGAAHNSSTFLVKRNMPDAFFAGSAFQQWCRLWATECLRVLKPGGHLLAFGGSRTWHRLAVAVEDAGFEIRDSIAWLYGSGFPKSLDVSKAIDRAAGAEREVVGPGRWNSVKGSAGKLGGLTPSGYVSHGGTRHNETSPATPESAQWQGWGTALKPAFEPIVVGRKPLAARTVAANVLRYGTGAMNVDGCRVEGAAPSVPRGKFAGSNNNMAMAGRNGTMSEPHASGRWPANVVLDEDAAAALDEQSGWQRDGSTVVQHGFRDEFVNGQGSDAGLPPAGFGGQGGASRFFYTAKAGSDERITHNGTAHPTVKPLSLMRWLVRLVTPPGGVILEPFAGSGTTVEAAILEGFRCIAIEREAEYLPLITQRINRRRDPVAYLTAAGDDLGLFGDGAA